MKIFVGTNIYFHYLTTYWSKSIYECDKNILSRYLNQPFHLQHQLIKKIALVNNCLPLSQNERNKTSVEK